MHTTYLNFYAALSVEASARTIHTISVARLQALERARQYYQTASQALESPKTKIILQQTPEKDEGRPTRRFYDSDDCDDTSSDGPGLSTPRRSLSTRSSIASDECISNAFDLKHPKLRIPESVISKERLPIAERSFHLDLSPCTPAGEHKQGYIFSTPVLEASADYTSKWLYNRDAERYNAYLSDFAIMLSKQIESIETLINAAKEAQAVRYTTRSLSSYGDDEEARAADLKDRVQRLKMEGWSRKRFDPSKYEQLCEVALAEL